MNEATPAQPVAWIPDMEHVANEWADMAINGLQHLRNIAEGISTVPEAIANMERCLKHCQDVRDASVQGKPPASQSQWFDPLQPEQPKPAVAQPVADKWLIQRSLDEARVLLARSINWIDPTHFNRFNDARDCLDDIIKFLDSPNAASQGKAQS